jgi:hypothetical protein
MIFTINQSMFLTSLTAMTLLSITEITHTQSSTEFTKVLSHDVEKHRKWQKNGAVIIDSLSRSFASQQTVFGYLLNSFVINRCKPPLHKAGDMGAR